MRIQKVVYLSTEPWILEKESRTEQSTLLSGRIEYSNLHPWPGPGVEIGIFYAAINIACVAACCSVLQCVAGCCSVLQCVAVCCTVTQRVKTVRNGA